MTAPWSAALVRRAAADDNNAMSREASWYDNQTRQHRTDIQAIEARISEGWDHLCAMLVPDLEPHTLDGLARRLGMPAINALNVQGGTRKEIDRLAAQLAEAEASPHYQNREGIRNECSILLVECDEMLAPLREVYSAIVEDPRYIRLRAQGYGTPSYGGRWWSLTYYRDWKESDELVAQFSLVVRATDYATLLLKVDEAREAAGTLQSERDTLVARVNQCALIEQQHEDATNGLAQMPVRRLAAVRGSVRGHLDPMAEDKLAALVGQDHAVVVALQRLAGLAAQSRYLTAAAQRDIFEPRAQVQAAIERNRRDIAKLSRPKNAGQTFPQEKMHKRFVGRPSAFNKRRERYEKTRSTITSFDSYDRGSLARDFLWWDLMTDRRLDGDFISEVHSHRQHYPASHHAHAVAAVADRSDTIDILAMHDGS